MEKQNNLSNRQALETRYKNSRTNLLLVVAFTVINMVLLITESDTYFLFSAYIPYALVTLGMLICGMFPSEYYGEEFSNLEFFGPSVFAVIVVISLIITSLYLLGWIFSKNNKVGWLIFALVVFGIDTVGMFLSMGFETENIIDIVFHAWVIISLVLGINAGFKLKKAPEKEIDTFGIEQINENSEG